MTENATLHYLKDTPYGSYRVVEIFGPTISGEGLQVGEPTIFIRLGGCDYRCSWCDSMHAVDPAAVKQARVMSVTEIMEEVDPPWNQPTNLITISGGNPAIWNLSPLIHKLHTKHRVAVETQGTIFRSWMYNVDILTVSPKPPSSGMKFSNGQFLNFCTRVQLAVRGQRVLKIVVDDTWDDMYFALQTMKEYEEFFDHLYLSTLTDPADSEKALLKRTDNVWSRFLKANIPHPKKPVHIFPQQHVLLWGHKQGV